MTDAEKIVPEEGNSKEEHATPPPQAAPSQPAVPSIPTPINPDTEKAPQTDIAKILQEVKLPERRDFKAAADKPQVEAPEQKAAILEEHIVKVASAGQAPAIQKVESPQKNEHTAAIITPVRTLKDDLQTIVREQKISLVHAASLEEEKRHGQEHLTPEQEQIRSNRSRRTVGILFASAILLLVGSGAIFGVYVVMQQQQSIPPAPQSSILFAEQTIGFPISNQKPEDLKAELAAARTKQLGSLGSITRIIPTVSTSSTNGSAQPAPASISDFFSALGIDPPQELMGAIGPNFFFGFHVVDTNAPILIIPVTSYDHAFAGMLSWEPNMDTDLAPVFNSVSMTTPQNGVPVQRTFQDAVMRNYDVRELTDDSGNIVLYYSFPTPNILVIAQSPYSFTEILSRLQAAREL